MSGESGGVVTANSEQHLKPIFALVEPVVEARGHQLYDVQQNGGTLAILVENNNGLGVDDLSELSRAVSGLLDEHDPIPGRYTLELSTPGVERKLRSERHFHGAVGELINVRTTPEPDGRRRLVGTLLSVEKGIISVQDSEAGVISLPLGQVEKARTVFEWGPAPKPGKSAESNRSNQRTKGGRQL
ncbi:MAG TPA: hypothetical protein DCY36_09375 [Acidimicrobiaceae bacterium]|nr:hypothetical protein [Acidimicrobiaceae bacterium]